MPQSSPPNSNRTLQSPRSTQAAAPKNEKKSAPGPRSESASVIREQIKSLIRNTFLASPEFPRLYADVVLSSAPNSNEARILAPHYKKIVERTNANIARANANKTKKETMTNVKTCTHIKVTGVLCGSPSLRGEQFCYFHQRMIRTVKGPETRIHHVALLENEEAIQASIMEVVNALIRGTIELKRGELILRALNAAVRNSRRVQFGQSNKMVTRIPSYGEPDPVAPKTNLETPAPDPTRPKPPVSVKLPEAPQERKIAEKVIVGKKTAANRTS